MVESMFALNERVEAQAALRRLSIVTGEYENSNNAKI
jgi:hypothetical protein